MRGEVLSQTEARPLSSSTQPLISGCTHILLPSGHDISVYIHSEDKQTKCLFAENVFLFESDMREKDKVILKTFQRQ